MISERDKSLIIKMQSDFLFFLEMCDIKLTDRQIEMVELIKSYDGVVNLISDPISGLSFLMCCHFMYRVCFEQNKTFVFVSPKMIMNENNKATLKMVYSNIPLFIRPKIVVDNSQSMMFENGIRILFMSNQSRYFRGLTCDSLWIDNSWHMTYSDELIMFIKHYVNKVYTTNTR